VPTSRFFVRSTELTGYTPARVGGAPAILRFGDIIGRIADVAGREAAALFSEPVLPRGAKGLGSAVSWYSSREGHVVELDAIDEVARKPIVDRLARRLDALAPALADPEIGATLSTWLNIPSSKDILAIGGEPVLVNWGFLPRDVALKPDHRRQHFARTLGRFAPQLGVPPAEVPAKGQSELTEPSGEETGFEPTSGLLATQTAIADGTTGSAAGTPPPPPNNSPADGGGMPPRSAGDPPAESTRSRPWLAPLVATALAAMVLLFLLYPGVLVYPGGSSGAREAFELERLRTSNQSLDDQLKAYQDAVRDRVCRPGDSILVPGTDPRADKDPPAPNMDLTPRTPDRVPVPETARPNSPQTVTLAELLESVTVLVLALGPSGTLTQGTGFFVSDRHILTNHHVVAGGDDHLIFVASQAMGSARRAKIVARSNPPPSEEDLRVDLAVLEIEPAAGRPFLKLGPTPPKLSTVYVSGYPGFLLTRDAQFQEFLRSLLTSLQKADNSNEELARQSLRVPGADLKLGRINNIMESGTNLLPILVHDMQLAEGNSGGPLVDACGRLGGVNTLLFKSSQGSQQGNVAQDVSIVLKFLLDQHIPLQRDDTPCQPAVEAQK
jgi:hypothetical protein